MDMSMPGGGDGDSSSLVPLNDSGVDFSNYTQAFNFQQEILDDSILQVIANTYARAFWYGVVVVIAIGAAVNFGRRLHLHLRLRAAAANKSRPAAAHNALSQFLGGVIATFREATYPQFSPARTYLWLKFPPLGIIIFLLTYLAFLMGLEFTDNNIPGAQHYTSLGVRASWLAVAQIPLLLLLAGKANLIGALVGVSYERLNVLHRWVSRGMLLLVTLHFGYQSYGWNEYGLMVLEWQTDTCPPTGIAAYALLLWLNITSLAPFRNRFYEFFVIQHVLSFIAFIYLVIAHLPSTALYSRVYVFAGIGIYFLDRLIRTLRYAYHNVQPARASITALEGGGTKIRVSSKQLKTWTPGSHVFLAIPRLGFGQSHPATIASIPSSHDGDLVFILRRRKGFTQRLHSTAESTASLLSSLEKDEKEDRPQIEEKCYLALIGGPYGGSHSDPAAFDTLLMVSGSTGITFMLSNLLSLAHRAQSTSRLPLRVVEFVWVVKQVCWTSWVSEELSTAVSKLQEKGIEVKVTIHVTCDENFAGHESEAEAPCCGCDKSLGPCCCIEAVPESSSAPESQNPKTSTSSSEKESSEKRDTIVTETAISKTSSNRTVRKSNLKGMEFAEFVSGRPNLKDTVWDLAEGAEGEMAVFVCGPLGLSTEVRNVVAAVSDERAVHKGTGAEGIYLHCEGFCW
jgi:ferric-chelate reductase